MRAIARHLLGLLIILCGMLPTMGQSKERLIWLVRDLPPFTIFEGTAKGQGVVDNLLPRLIAQMPEYDHSIVRVNRARGLQMLQSPALPAIRRCYGRLSAPSSCAFPSLRWGY